MSEVFEGEIIEIEAPTGNEARILPAFGRIADNGPDHHHRISPSRLRVGHLYLVWHCRVSLWRMPRIWRQIHLPLRRGTMDANGAPRRFGKYSWIGPLSPR